MMIDKQYENELLHEIDSLQRKLKEMTQNYNFEVELCKKVLKDYGKMSLALDMACDTIVDRGCTIGMTCSRNNCELYAPCSNEIRWKEYFLQKAGEDNDT